jgi:mannose-1-phosphate guanylyltransferase/mannose-6-phosphate isomerase
MTMARLAGLDGLQPAIVATGAAHLDLVEREIGNAPIETSTVLVEPVGRNTAPAVLAAAMVAAPEDVLVILPSDHLVSDVSGFRSALDTAVAAADDGAIVTFGIRPTRPETGYGYIEVGEPSATAFAVRRFIEKPTPEVASELVADERHLWNSGMFVARAGRLVEEGRTHCPALLDGVSAALPPDSGSVMRLGPSFAGVESISFDYAIMEKTDRAQVVPLDVGWDDVGSYRSLLGVTERDEEGNAVIGDVTLHDVSDSYVRATSRRVVVAGLEGFVVVETPEGVLVVPLDRAQDVRDLQRRDYPR